MALETFSSNDLLNFIIYDNTINASTILPPENGSSNFVPSPQQNLSRQIKGDASMIQPSGSSVVANAGPNRKRRRIRKQRAGKNKDETEIETDTQRMTHILVERNRRKQMNNHLDVLRSLMPESYVQRSDQASIVGGAIEFVKELEHLLQSLETQKFQTSNPSKDLIDDEHPFTQFFTHPQHKYGSTNDTESKSSYVDNMEVTLIETHTCVRILSRRCNRKQLSKLVLGFHALGLTILHLNVTTMEPFVLYTISAKIEEGSQLTSVDDIARAVHQMHTKIQDEPLLG